MNVTASTATDGATPTDGADDKPTYQNPNDLETELTEEQEQALVNETLGLAPPAGATDDSSSKPADDEEVGSADDSSKSTEDEKSTKPTEPEKPAAPAEEEEAPTAKPKEDPKPEEEGLDEQGIQVDDLWVEVDKVVEVADDGTVKTEKVKLTFDPQNPGAFLPDDFKFKSDKHLFEVVTAQQEMAALYKEREAKHEADQATKTTEQQAQEQQATQLKAWDVEIDDLFESGILEAPKVKPNEEGWKDDPSVQKIDAVFKFMAADNEKRIADGKEPIRSFGTALAKYEKAEADKAEEDKTKEENEKAKTAGAMVGGSSAASAGGGDTQKGYKPGSHSSIWDVPVEDE